MTLTPSPDDIEGQSPTAASPALSNVIKRLVWSRDELNAYRLARLRSLVAFAKTRSKWYEQRLANVDANRLTESDLETIPPMKKADLAEHFDEIVTDNRLSHDLCRRFLRGEDSANGEYLHGRFRVTTSGGSTGEPVLVVLSRREMMLAGLAFVRSIFHWSNRTSAWTDLPVLASVTAVLGRYRPQHVYWYLPTRETHTFSIDSPISEIVAGLNQARPDLLVIYPSLLPRLAYEAHVGRLVISPKLVVTGAEALLPEHESAVFQAWGCPVMDIWGAAEVGMLAVSSGVESGLLLLDDYAIVELVDRFGDLVHHGELAHKVYVTPLTRWTLPIIRYELADQLALINKPAASGLSFQRVSRVQGRLEDNFLYPGGVEVSAVALRGCFATTPNILEYQTSQTREGVEIKVTVSSTADLGHLARAVSECLRHFGLANPGVKVTQVPFIERSGPARKLARFIPLRNCP